MRSLGPSFVPPSGRVLFAAILLLFCVFPHCVPPVHAAEAPERGFQRAALVLQRLAPGEPWEPVVIPRSMERDDRASALLHHSDTFFVLASMAAEMDALGTTFLAAPHYAALAYRLVGRDRDAARCMALYMEYSPYRAADGRFLVRSLYDAGDYTAMRAAAARWQKAEGGCNEERLAYIWGSWMAQANYREARYAAQASRCSGWYPEILVLRAQTLAGETPDPDAALEFILLNHPDSAANIQSLWTDLTSRLRYP